MSAIEIEFEGRKIPARAGESLAAALTANGILALRTTRSEAERGIFCGMGVCQDCLVEVDGKPNQRACMTKLERPVAVRRESFGRTLPPIAHGEPPKLIDADLSQAATDIARAALVSLGAEEARAMHVRAALLVAIALVALLGLWLPRRT